MKSKRYKNLPKKTKELPPDLIDKILPLVKSNCTTKFDESVDVNFQINNKQKKSEINIRTVINLPGGTGKNVKVAVVCEENKIKEAKDAGADIAGSDEFIEKIKDGELNFEKLICTPKMMISLSKLGKILGPKGLMPNPKLGSGTNDLKKAIEIGVYKPVDFESKPVDYCGIKITSSPARPETSKGSLSFLKTQKHWMVRPLSFPMTGRIPCCISMFAILHR